MLFLFCYFLTTSFKIYKLFSNFLFFILGFWYTLLNFFEFYFKFFKKSFWVFWGQKKRV